MEQSMSYQAVKERCRTEVMKFGDRIQNGELTLEAAHKMLLAPDENKLDLFQIAALAQAISCFQCSDE